MIQSSRSVLVFLATALAGCSDLVTVNGTLLTQDTTAPVGGETVVISSGTFSASVVTGPNGAFTVADVPTPYNATLLGRQGDPNCPFQTEYVGLTRSDPTLVEAVIVNPSYVATFSGQLMGGSYPEASNYFTDILFASPEATVSVPYQPSGAYSASVDWSGPTETTGTLYALQVHYDGDSGLPVDYPGYGTLSDVLLESGGNLAKQVVSLSAVATTTLSGTVEVPSGYSVGLKSVALLAHSGVGLSLLNDLSDLGVPMTCLGS